MQVPVWLLEMSLVAPGHRLRLLCSLLQWGQGQKGAVVLTTVEKVPLLVESTHQSILELGA